MARRGDPEPIDRTRRTAISNRLAGSGMDPRVAERWCDAWEAEAALRDLKRDADYWDTGARWIETQCRARRQPPN